MGDFMHGIKLVSVCSYSFTDRKTIRVCYDSGEHVVYREIVDLHDLPASVQKFITSENYDSCDFEFSGPFWSCLSIFQNPLFHFPILHITDLDSEEDEPEVPPFLLRVVACATPDLIQSLYWYSPDCYSYIIAASQIIGGD